MDDVEEDLCRKREITLIQVIKPFKVCDHVRIHFSRYRREFVTLDIGVL